MNKTELISMVRTVLNEHGEELALSISDDNVKLNDYIDRALPDAVAKLAVDGKRINPKSLNSTIDYGVVEVPEDFISLAEVKLTTWKIPVVSVVEPYSPEYRRAMNRYTAPGAFSPICLRDGDNFKLLPTGNVERFVYNATLGDEFYGDARAASAVVYMAAALVCSYFEDDAAGQRLSEQAMTFLK